MNTRRITISIAIILFAFSSLLSFAANDTIYLEFSFPQITQNEDGMLRVEMDGCIMNGREGMPQLPARDFTALLPYGESLTCIEIISTEYFDEEINGLAAPASAQFPISIGAPKGYKPQARADIYQKNSWYPQSHLLHQNESAFRGFGLAQFSIMPCSMQPVEEKIRVIRKIGLIVHSEKSRNADERAAFLRNDNESLKLLSRYCDNVQNLASYPKMRTESSLDMIVITNEKMAPAFDEFLETKQMLGLASGIITTEEIENQYAGIDKQEQIRNCIIDYYQNQGISYVVLGGDSDPKNPQNNIIPHRGIYLGIMDETDLPSDMYYGGLDGNWNENGNNRWGEANEVDYFMEVSVGRICTDNIDDTRIFLNKIIRYSTDPVIEDITKALMLGENLDDNPTWGGDSKDDVAAGSNAHGISTAGFPEQFTISRLYDREQIWNKGSVFQHFNTEGLHILNHLGHSNTTFNMKMNNSDVSTMSVHNDGVNRSYVIGYSQGCYNGSFDNRLTSPAAYTVDCFAENITNMPGGMVASLSNSRYGWYSPSNTDGISQFFDREFFDALFGEDIYEIGRMNDDSKHELASWMQENDYMRWGGLEIILFGDPSMDVWTNTPQEIANAVIPESIGYEDLAIEIGAGFENARIALMQNGELIGRGRSTSNGMEEFSFFKALETPMDIEVFISGHNHLILRDTVKVIYNGPFLVSTEAMFLESASNPYANDSIDNGELVDIAVHLYNYGSQTATNISMKLIDSCIYAQNIGTTGQWTFENLGPREEIYFTTFGSAVQISDSLPDQYEMKFMMQFSSETQQWDCPVVCNVNAPLPSELPVSWDDAASAYANNQPDPGESLILELPIHNEGHAALHDIEVQAESRNPYIALDENTAQISELNALSTQMAYFPLTISEQMQIGECGTVHFQINAGAYTHTYDLLVYVGLQVEDFESQSYDKFDWKMEGKDWKIRYKTPAEGDFYAQSGPIGDNDFSKLSIEIDVTKDTTISFYAKTSSEPKDVLRFYIDDEVLGEWSGKTEWEWVSFPVSSGLHKLSWNFEKDYDASAGFDVGMVDYIVFPPFRRITTALDEMAKESSQAYPNPFSNYMNIICGEKAEYFIHDLSGKCLMKAHIPAGKSIINTENLAHGLYILEVREAGEINFQKILKAN